MDLARLEEDDMMPWPKMGLDGITLVSLSLSSFRVLLGHHLEALDTSAEVRTRGDAGSTQARGKRATLSRGDALLSARDARRARGFSDEKGEEEKESVDSQITFPSSAHSAFIATH